jgi:uncharacterized membrane protein
MDDGKKTGFKAVLLASAGALLIIFALSSYVWTQIPSGQEVCIHWNAAGECDRYGSKFTGIFMMPIVIAAMVVMFAVIPRVGPRAANILRSRTAYSAVWAAMLVFFLALHIIMMLHLLGRVTTIGTYTPLLVGLLLIVIGSFMGRIRSNYFFGIRTPWTLASELAWTKTHQLGGKLFVAEGLILMLATVLLPSQVWPTVLVASTLLLVAVLMVYSYLIWRRDPEARAG